MDKGIRTNTLKIALIATFAAMMTGGKLALTFIPNVEPVTLFIVLISSVFGLSYSLPAALIFVSVESYIYGFNYWLIPYYIYFPLLATVFYLLTRKKKSIFFNAAAAAVMTMIFGVLTTAADAIFLGDFNYELFFKLFGAYYARGAVFFIVHIVSNFVIVLFLYKPLSEFLIKIKQKMQI